MIIFKQCSWLILLALNCQAMPQYDYPAYDAYGNTIEPFEIPVGTCNLPADLGGKGKKICSYTVWSVNAHRAMRAKNFPFLYEDGLRAVMGVK